MAHKSTLFLLAITLISLAFAAKYRSKSDSAQPKADSLTPNSYETPASAPLSAALSPTVLEQVSNPFEQIEAANDRATTRGVFTHQNLPGFSLQYPGEWAVAIKEFKEEDPSGSLHPYYFPTCHDRCMSLRITKAQTGLQLFFQLAQDNSYFMCSNKAEVTKVNDKWDRIRYEVPVENLITGIYYSTNVTVNERIGSPSQPEDMSVDGVRQTLTGEAFNVCDYTSGNRLNQAPQETVWGDYAPSEFSILMEKPRVLGIPSAEELQTIDQMVMSIEGVEGRFELLAE